MSRTLALLITLCVINQSCGRGEQSSRPRNRATLVGTWTYDREYMVSHRDELAQLATSNLDDESQATFFAFLDLMSEPQSSITLHFHADGTYEGEVRVLDPETGTADPTVQSGRYTTTGRPPRLTLRQTREDGEVETHEVELRGNELRMPYDVEHPEVQLVLRRNT